jgi:hypothetical protein
MSTEEITLKTVADDRMTIRLSSPVKHAFVAIQKYKNYSYTGMLSDYLDYYTKHNEGVTDEILTYCRATISDKEIVSDIEQLFNDFSQSKIERVSTLSKKVSIMEREIKDLKSQIKMILNNNPNIVIQGITIEDASDTTPNATSDSKLNNVDMLDSFFRELSSSVNIADTSFPSNIHVYANTSLNSDIGLVLSKHIESKAVLDYDYYIDNYNDLKHSVTTIVNAKIDVFTNELLSLLKTHCDNAEMRNALLPRNPNILSKYIETRLTFEGIVLNDVLPNIDIKNIWSLTLLELHQVISLLTPYTVTDDFKVSVSTMKQPQSALKTVLNKSYGFIVTDAPFTTF